MWRAASVFLIAILGVGSLGFQQSPPDPLDVLRRTTEALERLHVVHYDARYTRSTVLSDEIVVVNGSVTFSRGTPAEAARLKAEYDECVAALRADFEREATRRVTDGLMAIAGYGSGPRSAEGGEP